MLQNPTEHKWESFDGSERAFLLWDKVSDIENVKGTVQIIHGMAEHAARYGDFAAFLNQNGYIVAALQLRAHKDAHIKGYESGDVFEKTTYDNLAFTEYLTNRFDVKVSVFGHSYGSMIAQNYLTYDPIIKCVILSGSAMRTDMQVKAGLILSLFQKLITGGGKNSAKFINKRTFGAFDKHFREENQKFAWLTRDLEVCRRYANDPLCGYLMSVNFYASFFAGLQKISMEDNIARINKSLPIMIASGDQDPVGGYGKFVEELYGQYLKNGLRKIKFKLYKDARHELINEINKDEVYADILDFLSLSR